MSHRRLVVSPSATSTAASASSADLRCLPETNDVRELLGSIESDHRALEELLVGTAFRMIRIGHYLKRLKQLVPTGEFMRFLDENIVQKIGISQRTINRYLQMANRADEIRHTLMKSKSLSDEAAEAELQTLSYQQAVELLSQTVTSSRQAIPKLAASVRTAVEEFFGGLHYDTQTAAQLEDVVHAARRVLFATSGKEVASAIQMIEPSPPSTECLLVVPSGQKAAWSLDLSRYPRCVVPPQIIIAVIPSSRTHDFGRAFLPLSNVYLPAFDILQ